MGQKEFISSTSLAFSYFCRCQYENLTQGNLHFNVWIEIVIFFIGNYIKGKNHINFKKDRENL